MNRRIKFKDKVSNCSPKVNKVGYSIIYILWIWIDCIEFALCICIVFGETFWFIYGSQNPQHICCPLSWFTMDKEQIFVHIWNGNGNGSSWIVLHFQVLVDSIHLTWCHAAKSSHLTAKVMTDRHTHTHTHTHTLTDRQIKYLGKKHNTFFQRYN